MLDKIASKQKIKLFRFCYYCDIDFENLRRYGKSRKNQTEVKISFWHILKVWEILFLVLFVLYH